MESKVPVRRLGSVLLIVAGLLCVTAYFAMLLRPAVFAGHGYDAHSGQAKLGVALIAIACLNLGHRLGK
ncbi:hypothetical protein [Terriglobus sp.]|uniref:hypothetical protein n=1 Tax=Terriglobus sp. TaxID=1889013 RepID=UPI003B00FE8C